MRRIGGANMDIDFSKTKGMDWMPGECPWGKNYKCAVKNTSICKYFEGVEKWDTLLCGYPKEKGMISDDQLHVVAVTGFLYRDGKFIILKRSEKEIQSPGKWTVPGGKVERGDTILEALEKEIKEETGLETEKEFEFLGDSEFTRPDGYHVVVPRFLCRAKSGEVNIDKNDFTDHAWISLDEIGNYDLIPGVKKALEEVKDNNLLKRAK